MSLSYRTPVEHLINQLPARLTDNLAVNQVDILQSEEECLGQFLNFNLSTEKKKFLVDKGIYLSPYSWKHHTHPGCKTIENWLLYKEIGSYCKHMSKENAVTFISLREGKLNALKRIHFKKKEDKETCEKIKSFNRFYCCKDKLRYKSNENKEIIYKTFDDLRFKNGIDGTYYIHDECHHWSPSDLQNFLVKTQANTLLATIIHPVEVDVGKNCSHLPFLYEFEVEGKTLFFFPDGNKSEGYEQPKTAGWWLQMRRFHCDGNVYSATLIRSIGPFHLMLISKGSMTVETKRFFDDFNILDLPLGYVAKNLIRKMQLVLRTNFMVKIISYIKSLKKPDRESAIAKLRMMSEDNFSIEEMMFVEGLVNSLLSDSYRSLFEKGWSEWFIMGLKDCLPDNLHSALFRTHFKAKENLDLLLNLKNLSIEVTTADYFPDTRINVVTNYINKNFSNDDYKAKDRICDIIRSSRISEFLSGELFFEYGTETNVMGEQRFHNSFTSYKFKKERTNVELDRSMEEMNEESLLNLYRTRNVWFRRNTERVRAAEAKSLEIAGNIFDSYVVIPDEEVIKTSLILGFNNGFHLMPKETNTNDEASLFKINGFHKKILRLKYDSEERIESIRTFKEQIPRQVLFFEKFIKQDSEEMVEVTPSNEIQGEASSSKEKFKESEKIDERTFCNLENKCCFDAVMTCLDINYEQLLDCLIGTKFLGLLMQDEGLLFDELVDLCDQLNLNVNIIDTGGNVFKKKEGAIRTLLLTSNHCQVVSNDIVTKWSDLEEKKIMNIPSLSLITKSLFDKDRAFKIYNSFKKGTSGVLINSMIQKTKESNKGSQKNRNMEMFDFFFNFEGKEDIIIKDRGMPCYASFGFAGSGKSRAIQDHINSEYAIDGNVTIISPRNELLNDWRNKISPGNKCIRIVTYEKALTISYLKDELIVLDEISLLPPGYISLLSLATCFRVEEIAKNIRLSQKNFTKYISEQSCQIIMLGDHLQSRYYNEHDVRILSSVDEIDYIMNNEETVYLNYSRRMFRNHHYKPSVDFFGEGQVKTSRRFSNVYTAKKAIPDAQILVASRDEQLRFRDMGAKTFGESQGLTFEEVIIVLSPPSINCSVNMWNVAMSRSRAAVHFALNGIDTIDDFLNKVKGTPVSAMVLGLPFDIHKVPLTQNINFKLIKVSKMKISNHEVELKLEGDPYLKSIIPSLDEGLPIDLEYKDILMESPVPKTHLPIESIFGHVCYISDNIKERYEREFIGDGLISEQFPDFWKIGEPGSFLSQAERFQSIFPKHSNNDSLTFLAAVKKRLKFSSPAVEREKFEKVRHLGEEMLEVFLEKVKVCNKYDDLMMTKSYNEYVQKKTSKTGRTIESHSKRSEPDWNMNEIFLFMKTQLCTKYEKRFSDAKAGQTLACFSHVVLNRFAGPTRYIEKKISSGLPSNYYIHQKKNFDVLNEWVVNNKFNGLCLESDYEAFDSSQDCLILAFEYELLKYLGWDQQLLDDYLTIKFNLGCRLGNLAVMRFTGEFGTFLFNTLANMVFTFMSYDLDGNESICFAGDDMCCNKGVKKRSDQKYDHILKRLTLKAKTCLTLEPTFCGWRLTKYGIFKKPALVLERFLIAMEKGRLHDVIDSYYLECSYAYNLGERLYECFSEKDFQAHYCCIRIVHKNIKLLKGLSLEKYRTNNRYCHSCKSSKMTTSCSNLTKVGEMSPVLNSVRYMMMGDSQITGGLDQHRALKAPYQSSREMVKGKSSKGYQLLIMSVLLRKKEKGDTRRLILGRLSLAYINWVIMNEKSPKESVCYWTIEEKEAPVLLKYSTLIYLQGPLIFLLFPMQHSMCLTTCLIKHVICTFHLRMSITMKAHDRFPLRSGQFTGTPMLLTVITNWAYQEEEEPLGIHIKKSTQLPSSMKKVKGKCIWKCLSQKKMGLFVSSDLKRKCSNQKGSVQKYFLGRSLDHLQGGNIQLTMYLIWKEKKYANLGQASVTLMKEEFLIKYWVVRLELPVNHLTGRAGSGRMADQQVAVNQALNDWINATDGFQGEAYGIRVRKLRRRTLMRQHWVTVLKALVQTLGHANDPQNFTAVETQTYGRIMSDFAAHAFGILAEEGFSPATIYNEVETFYTIEYPAPVGRITINFAPAEISRQFKYYAHSSSNNIFTGITWRQIGECFATDVVRYFKELQVDAQSWLVRSNPVLAGNAPWVALDITDGLDIRNLNPEEKKVIARAKNHLLKSMQFKGRDSLAAEALLES